MANKAVWYAPELGQQVVTSAKNSRNAASLLREFGPSAKTIGTWTKQAARDDGQGDGGLTSTEREELTPLRRVNRRLKENREILPKAAAWSAPRRARGAEPSTRFLRSQAEARMDRLRVDRGLVQSESSVLWPRLPLAGQAVKRRSQDYNTNLSTKAGQLQNASTKPR